MQCRKKLFVLLFIICCSCLFHTTVFAAEKESITIHVNGTEVSEATPYITVIDQSVYIPLRIMAESLGAIVNWHAEESKIIVERNAHQIVFWLNENKVLVDNSEVYVSWQPFAIEGVTYIPVRFFAESFGLFVEWMQTTKQVILSHDKSILMMNKPVIQATNEEIKWLAKLIEAEASGEPFEGKIAVGAVVINRVQSELFPNTIKEVIFQKSYGYYQFTPVSNQCIYEVEPSSESLQAAEKALLGEDPSNGALYFYNPRTSSSKWLQSREVSKEIGSHRFTY